MKSDFRDWSDVRVFLAVVRAGSTLAASKALGLAQPTVARRIDALEHALGLVLFERDTRGFQPTAEGLALVGPAQAMETAATVFADKAGRLIAGRTRTIRLTAYKEAFTGRMPIVLEEFLSRHSDVKFEFISSDEVVDISGGAADVAIRVAQHIDDPSLICRKVREISISLFASKGYAAKQPLPSSESEFGGHMFIARGGRHSGQVFNTWLLARTEPEQIVMASEDASAIEAAVLMGAGIAALPTPFGDTNDNVINCLTLPPVNSLQVWMLVNPAAYRRPEVKAFTAFFAPRYRALFQT